MLTTRARQLTVGRCPGGSDMSGGARFMVLADSEMHNAVNHAGRVCRDVGCCEGDFVFEADLVFHVAEE